MSDNTSKFINRELSWLEFNRRVLNEAGEERNPLLERLKFLAITASNLDEFYMVRVGGLQLLSAQGRARRDPSGMTPDEQLEAISRRTQEIIFNQYRIYLEQLKPQLAAAGIKQLREDDLSDRQATVLENIFDDEILSVLTPIAVASPEDFPRLESGSLNVCVRLEPAADAESGADTPAPPRFAVIPFGRGHSRLITLPSEGGYEYVLLEDVVSMYVERFFPGEPIVECVPFRITRNADLSIQEDQAADLLREMEEVLDARQESQCVRLEISDQVTTATLEFLVGCLQVGRRNIFALPGPIDFTAMFRLTELRGFDELAFEPWPPRSSPHVDPAVGMFDTIRDHDVLLYHPYESFEPIVRLMEEAADDPDVLAIKQTLYRTSRNSPIVAALARAAERGKYVTAIVELKARFDEARNIEWARNLEQAGVQVIYGVKRLKTHAKVLIIVRREPDGIRRYIHFGTGNYNEITSRLYSDASLLTCDEELGADAGSFFNAVTGYSQPQQYRKLEQAPIGLRDAILELIEVEIERKRNGQEARIAAKLNSLVDPSIIEALYAASQAGVTIQLNVRGICCLRPGVEGLSDNITVTSIIDRFLEHARILYFYHGDDERVFISSADWMPRNLDRRLELLIPVEDHTLRKRLIAILEACFADTSNSHLLQPDGSYVRIEPAEGERPFRCQEALYEEACRAITEAEQSARTVFEPHRAPGTEV